MASIVRSALFAKQLSLSELDATREQRESTPALPVDKQILLSQVLSGGRQPRIVEEIPRIGTISHGSTALPARNPLEVYRDSLISEGRLEEAGNAQNELDVLAQEELKSINNQIRTSDVSFEDNILTSFDNVTFHFRFFITKESSINSSVNRDEKIIIAESGVTGFGITEARINTIISPAARNRNSIATQIKFTIIEPHGNNLLDQIRNAAVSLGVKDHRNAPLWFEVSFLGYNGPNEQSHTGGEPTGFLSNETRRWKLKVKYMDADVDKGGTIYRFEAIPFDESGLEDAARRLEKDENIDASTVGEYFSQLANRLNDYNNFNTTESENPDNAVPRLRTYDFQFTDAYPTMKDWKLRSDDSSQHIRSESPNNDGSTRTRVTFSKGTTIEAIVQEIIGATKEGQSLALFGNLTSDTSNVGGSGGQGRDPSDPAIVFIVDPKAEITGYYNIPKGYALNITYNIRSYRTFYPIVNRNQITQTQTNQRARERFQAFLKISKIKKRYDFMFTGLNTEVLDYKIHFDRAWFLSLPIFQGQNRNPVPGSGRNAAKVGAGVPRQVAVDKEKSKKSIEPPISTDDDFIFGQFGESILLSTNLTPEDQEEQIVKGSKSLPTTRELSNLSQADANFLTQEDKSLLSSTFGARIPNTTQSSGKILIDLENKTEKRNQESILNRKSTASTSELTLAASPDHVGSILFVEDFSEESINQDLPQGRNTEIYDLGTELDVTVSPFQGNIEGTASKGRSYFSAIMNQMYGTQGQMVKLDLEIRGDPYWLGETDVEKRIIASNTSSNNQDITGGDSLLLMTFNFPERFGDSNEFSDNAFSHTGSGLVEIKSKENGFNGVYYVTTVESIFTGGKFTQRLSGYADPLTREQDVLRLARVKGER